MKSRYTISNLLTVSALALILLTVAIVIVALGKSPVMVDRPEAAVRQAEKMMDAICAGDYKTASAVMYGSPNLGTYPENANMAAILIWDAYLESLEYGFSGECYATDSGVAVDMQVKCLDVSASINGLDKYAQDLLNQRIEQAEDMRELYDEENNFRQDMIDDILRESAMLSLEENKEYKQMDLTLHLTYEQGQWWVVPDAALQNVLAGAFGS